MHVKEKKNQWSKCLLTTDQTRKLKTLTIYDELIIVNN